MNTAWLLPIIFSALTLGFYDICKKDAVKDNSVMPALFFATLSGSIFFVMATAASGEISRAVCCPVSHYLLTLLKSAIVSGSWICVFYAMRELPITLASPLRATAPMWTMIGGLLLFHETPTRVQAAGMFIIFIGYLLFNLIGKTEGFNWKSKGIVLIVAGTLLGAVSALFDKYLLHVVRIDRQVLQFYFSVNLVAVLGIALALRSCFGQKHPFKWKWTIPLTGILLIIADYAYFYALSTDNAPISMVSLVRRCNCIVTFAVGAKLFKDSRVKSKAAALLLILLGVALIALG